MDRYCNGCGLLVDRLQSKVSHKIIIIICSLGVNAYVPCIVTVFAHTHTHTHVLAEVKQTKKNKSVTVVGLLGPISFSYGGGG